MIQLVTIFETRPAFDQPSRRERAVSNGVPISPTTILTVAHVLSHQGARRLETFVGGQRVNVLKNDGDLALLGVEHGQEGVPIYGWEDGAIGDGQPLLHRWITPEGDTMERTVCWSDTQHTPEGFEQGMSGSGLYFDGKLAGIAEWTNGFYWGPLDIGAFLNGQL